MPQISFTGRKISALPIPDKGQADYYDKSTPGFAIRVSYGGTKTWFVKYVHQGRQRRMTLGQYPAVSLADARREALAAKHELVIEKQDPASTRKVDREALTFKALADLYVDEYAKVKKRSWPEDERVLGKYFVRWHNRKAGDIDRGEIVERLQGIKRDHGPVMANRCLAVVRKMYSWALRNGKLSLTHNPALRLDAPGQETERDRVYSDAEIKRLWAAFGKCGTPGAVFKVLLVTGQRLNEIARMEWKEIDGDLLTLPGARTKNKRVHVVPLSDLALDLLDKQRGQHKRFVFPSPKGLDQPISNVGKAVRGTNGKKKPSKRNVQHLSGVDDFRPHDLRRTTSTGITRLGFTRFVADRLLNHVEPGIGGVYDRYSYAKEKAEAAQAWSRHLRSIIGEAGNVVQLAAS